MKKRCRSCREFRNIDYEYDYEKSEEVCVYCLESKAVGVMEDKK